MIEGLGNRVIGLRAYTLVLLAGRPYLVIPVIGCQVPAFDCRVMVR